MTDWHVHVGQWNDVYYDPAAVVRALASSGTDEFWFSSTSSCRYCKESAAVQDKRDLWESLPTARELYECIKGEVENALVAAKDCGVRAHPLYWVIPEVHFSSDAGITVENAMSEISYEGFKLHPRGNPWDLDNPQTLSLAHEVFSYARERQLSYTDSCGTRPIRTTLSFHASHRGVPERHGAIGALPSIGGCTRYVAEVPECGLRHGVRR